MTSTLHAIIGTAGHIDHGKTALVKALTGTDTDRLKEEKERGISIDLGFAALTLGDRRIGIVDVPGHERFIRNMLAGAHALDLVLFTIAADDGVMPQTEEHLDIVHLLGVERGIVVITKTDLVAAERVTEVNEEIAILVAGTRLEGAPVVPISVVTGAGMTELVAELGRQLRSIERPPPAGRFRLPVDRAFVLKGHGVVVTGTAVAGTIAPGAEVHALPGGERARVRSVEVHGTPAASAGWRQRIALNLVGLERTELTRGHVIADPGLTLVSDRFDARVEVRPAARRGIAHHARVRVHLGTAESLAKLVLLDDRPLLAAKQHGWAQIVVDHPLVALRGDRFILRAANAQATLGGGEVVLPVADRHRRGDDRVLACLERIRSGNPDRNLDDAAPALLEIAREFALGAGEIAERLNAADAAVGAALRGAAGLLALPDGTASEAWTTAAKWARLRSAVAALVADFHAATPLAPGLEMEAVRARLAPDASPRLFRSVADRLVAEGVVVRRDSLLAAPGHRVALAGDAQALAERVDAALVRAGLTPPDVNALAAELDIAPRRALDLLGVLEKSGRAVRVAPELFYAAPTLTEVRAVLERELRRRAQITAAELRDVLQISRKFSIALLDYFDRTGVTLRVGDARKLRRE